MVYFQSMRKPAVIKIGVLIELSREFGRELCKGIIEFASQNGGFDPVFITPKSLGNRQALTGFGGFIARVMTDEIAKVLSKTGKPVVDVYYEKPHAGFAVVKTNHAKIGRIAAQHFLDRKFKNFAFCGFAGGRFSKYCLLGYRRALTSAGCTCTAYQPSESTRYEFDSSVLIAEKLNLAPDRKSLIKWVKSLPKPIAVFCPNDLRAWQLLNVCKEYGVDVPREMAILGLDNDSIVCGFCRPMISSVDPDCMAIGREAAHTLMEMIAKPHLAKKQIVRQVNPIGVVERASTEVYPLNPPWISDALVYIHKHVSDRLTADDVFKHLGLSHTIVSRTFRKVLNTTVQKEIADSRLETARHFLANTNLSAAEIAGRAGFGSSSYFMRRFTSEHGMAPLAWRKSSKNIQRNYTEI